MNRRTLLGAVAGCALVPFAKVFGKGEDEEGQEKPKEKAKAKKPKGGWKRTEDCCRCRFWDRVDLIIIPDDRGAIADCRRGIPSDGFDGCAVWIKTSSNQWCGEFVRAEKGQVRAEIAVVQRRLNRCKKKKGRKS